METLNILEHVQFDKQKPVVRTLLPGPGSRVMLLCLGSGQVIPEHSAAAPITVQALSGRTTFFDESTPFDMSGGVLLRLDAGRKHRLEAQDDSVLLVTILDGSAQAQSPGEARGD
ncbi:MAG: cupin domain-containing protein [Bryobacteraceae bacterium]